MQKQSEDPETDDEELNVTSPKFNPIKALYSKKFQMQTKKAKSFDNMSSLMSAIKKAGNALDADFEKISKLNIKKAEMEAESVDTEKFHVTEGGRKFLKEQGELKI